MNHDAINNRKPGTFSPQRILPSTKGFVRRLHVVDPEYPATIDACRRWIRRALEENQTEVALIWRAIELAQDRTRLIQLQAD